MRSAVPCMTSVSTSIGAHPIGTVGAEVACYLSAPHRESAEHDVVQVELCQEAAEVMGEGVIVVPDAWLARLPKAAAVVCDDARASVQQRRDLLLPGAAA